MQTFGREGMLTAGEAFYPLFLLPNFHGPHFHEALRRLLLPGRGPFVAHLAVTGACPCRCEYCYLSAGESDAPDLGDERLLEVARSIVLAEVPVVSLEGGEPLARFERLVQCVELLAPFCEVRLATSGVGLTAERALRLRRAGLSVLAVSLDSDDREAVNETRGSPVAFDAAVAGLRHAGAAGIVTFVTAVVDRAGFENVAGVHRFLSFVRDIDTQILVNFLPRFATGRAATNGGFRSPDEYAPVAQRLARAIRAGRHRATVFGRPLELLMGCVGAGRRQLNIDPAGNVMTCVSGASFGNVVDEPLDRIVRRWSSADTRLKRGFFCAEIGEQTDGGAVLDPAASERALDAFYATHPDTLFQRLLDVAGPQLAWMIEG